MSHRLNAFEMDTILTSRGHHNPASFGTYPRILGYYVRELGLLTLEDAISRMTGMAAERMRLGGRGLVRKGCAANSRAPEQSPAGIEYVLVNGRPLVENGKWRGTGVLAGQWLSRA